MSLQAEVKIEGIDELAKLYSKGPEIAAPIFADGINEILSQISANAIDGGDDDLFRFVTPRSLRTGLLNLSFNQGIRLATASQLWGSIGPTVYYAIFVHEGTSRGIKANPFMDRLAKQIEPTVELIMQRKIDELASKLTP